MKYKVTQATNFLRVFRLPDEYPSDYCFGGGHSVEIQLLDWFNAFSQQDFWEKDEKEVDTTEQEYIDHIDSLKQFIKEKIYFNSNKTYMVLTDYGDSFVINPELRVGKLQEELDEIKKKNFNSLPEKQKENK